MIYRQSKDATVAAAKSGFSRATGYRIEDDPAAALAEESATWPTAAGPLGRGLGRRDRTDPEIGSRHSGDRGARRDPAAPSGDWRRHSAHAGRTHAQLASPGRAPSRM
jgi:hypothetical protein